MINGDGLHWERWRPRRRVRGWNNCAGEGVIVYDGGAHRVTRPTCKVHFVSIGQIRRNGVLNLRSSESNCG